MDNEAHQFKQFKILLHALYFVGNNINTLHNYIVLESNYSTGSNFNSWAPFDTVRNGGSSDSIRYKCHLINRSGGCIPRSQISKRGLIIIPEILKTLLVNIYIVYNMNMLQIIIK